jgi:hypothetical protein
VIPVIALMVFISASKISAAIFKEEDLVFAGETLQESLDKPTANPKFQMVIQKLVPWTT